MSYYVESKVKNDKPDCFGDDDEYNQRMEQGPFAAACETQFVRLASAETADEVVRKAFYLAKLNSKPVMLSAPRSISRPRMRTTSATRSVASTCRTRSMNSFR